MSQPKSLKERLTARLLPPLKLDNNADHATFDSDSDGFLRDKYQEQVDAWYAELKSNVEALFASAVEVYCAKPDTANSHLWAHRESSDYDTHRGLLLGVEPIQRGVDLSEVIEALRSAGHVDSEIEAFNALADRLEREGVRK